MRIQAQEPSYIPSKKNHDIFKTSDHKTLCVWTSRAWTSVRALTQEKVKNEEPNGTMEKKIVLQQICNAWKKW
jgi:hypothetical protein